MLVDDEILYLTIVADFVNSNFIWEAEIPNNPPSWARFKLLLRMSVAEDWHWLYLLKGLHLLENGFFLLLHWIVFGLSSWDEIILTNIFEVWPNYHKVIQEPDKILGCQLREPWVRGVVRENLADAISITCSDSDLACHVRVSQLWNVILLKASGKNICWSLLRYLFLTTTSPLKCWKFIKVLSWS